MLLQPETSLGMRQGTLLVFGGPYSNLAATLAMLEQVRVADVAADQVICTGDLVAYCAEPEQVCRAVIDAGIHVVMGNCEESLAADSDDCGCGFEPGMLCSTLSQGWYRYARQRVSGATRKWMSMLPRRIRFEFGGLKFSVVHGAADSINDFVFASTDEDFKRRQLELTGSDVIIAGHSGIPFAQAVDGRYWLNAGVIGLPANDGRRGGWFLRLDCRDDSVVASWHHLDYTVDSSYQAMMEAGLEAYSVTLLDGLWPSMDVLPENERRAAGRPLELPPVRLA